jgi:surface protein
MPDVTGQQRFAGLHRIDPESNFVALTAAGAYTVDWGDGTTTNHAAWTTAYKQYDYSAISNTGESVLGYRQVLIEVYPQAANDLTSLSIQVRHNQTLISTYSPGWLEVAVNGPNLTTLSIGGSIPLLSLHAATVMQTGITSMANLFQNCRALKSVQLTSTSSVTAMNSMFISCSSLTTVPLFNTAAVTNMTSMFNSCPSLTTVPLFNTTVVNNMTSMFSGCTALTSVPLFNTPAVTNVASMFLNCTSLNAVPLFNTAAVTTMSQFFMNCTSLTTIPAFVTTSSLIATPQMFSNCTALTTIPPFNTASVTTTASMFASCTSLSTGALSGTNVAISYANCKLSADALNEIYTGLSSTGTGKTITVTGNWGTATDNPAIATAKGWTVTG